MPAAMCGFYYKSGILERKFSFVRCRYAGRDVIELCYKSEAVLSFKEYLKTILLFHRIHY
jgi:hypothetical protein